MLMKIPRYTLLNPISFTHPTLPGIEKPQRLVNFFTAFFFSFFWLHISSPLPPLSCVISSVLLLPGLPLPPQSDIPFSSSLVFLFPPQGDILFSSSLVFLFPPQGDILFSSSLVFLFPHRVILIFTRCANWYEGYHGD